MLSHNLSHSPPPAIEAADGDATELAFGTTEGPFSQEIDEHFASVHLTRCPKAVLSSVRKLFGHEDNLSTIQRATAGKEERMYKPLVTVLNHISQEMFKSFSRAKRVKLGLDRRPILFLRHNGRSLARPPIPKPGLLDDRPAIVGVLGDEKGFQTFIDGPCQGVPYHRVETFVHLEPQSGADSVRESALGYLFRLQQARADRPRCYALCGQAKQFQVLYASPLGIKASAPTAWDNLPVLCDYVRSLYEPPREHVLRDPKVNRSETSLSSSARRTIETADQDATGAAILFLGCPCASCTGSRVMTLKDSFIDPDRSSNKARLSPNIHAEGDSPGVVRLVSAEDVKCNGRDIDFTSGDSDKTRPKRCLTFADADLGLEHAESVNDLLMSIYDVLEVHRELARRRHVSHSDMSVSNILMYPKRRSALKQANRLESFPPLIDDILAGEQREPEEREPRCLLIDYDHAAKLLDVGRDKGMPKELRYRTGTPTYIARAVSASVVFCRGRVEYLRMPLLSENAEPLYVKVHGEDRYRKYNDDANTQRFHGGVPREEHPDQLRKTARNLPFCHRWEYDAESVFWSMYSLLLRVLPADYDDDDEAVVESLLHTWKVLKTHSIPSPNLVAKDMRQGLLEQSRKYYLAPSPPVMHDVATMFYQISRQVEPSYALMSTPPPLDDHLHEAMQRIILDYLVAHEDDPIPLTPGVVRNPIRPTGEDVGREHSTDSDDAGSGTDTMTAGRKRRRPPQIDHSKPHKPRKSRRRR